MVDMGILHGGPTKLGKGELLHVTQTSSNTGPNRLLHEPLQVTKSMKTSLHREFSILFQGSALKRVRGVGDQFYAGLADEARRGGEEGGNDVV
ncbi:hypothetical protein VNO78_28071 [Psophocarpus tetragonolobus]|uniref:Uncharacterized protein n=1 Tax=Psophocarpus tetragonolobus TaxID=3891 RepID=A0AAN9XCX3_PSOTE